MTTTTITNFRKNLFEYVRSAIDHNDVIDVTTKDGSAVVMSREDYEALMETLYIASVPDIAQRVEEGFSRENLVSAEDINW